MAHKVFGLLDRNNNGVASAEEIQAIFETWLDINRDGIIMPQEMYNATEELFGQFCEDVKEANTTLPGISSSLTP
jgi:Ca2+-binding EF-hand superfamily protein